MKIRESFVSNSSSTSFIVQEKNVQELCTKHNIECFKVSDLVESIKKYKNLIKELKSEFPYFMVEFWEWEYNEPDYFKKVMELYEKDPDCYITESYDRNLAWEKGINYPVFEGDL